MRHLVPERDLLVVHVYLTLTQGFKKTSLVNAAEKRSVVSLAIAVNVPNIKESFLFMYPSTCILLQRNT